MVNYTQWVEIGHSVFTSKGGEYSQSTATEVTSVLADYWNENKESLKSAGPSQARQIAREQMTV